jgi:hypothetical protein
MAGYGENGNKLLGCIKTGDFIYKLRYYEFPRMDLDKGISFCTHIGLLTWC